MASAIASRLKAIQVSVTKLMATVEKAEKTAAAAAKKKASVKPKAVARKAKK